MSSGSCFGSDFGFCSCFGSDFGFGSCFGSNFDFGSGSCSFCSSCSGSKVLGCDPFFFLCSVNCASHDFWSHVCETSSPCDYYGSSCQTHRFSCRRGLDSGSFVFWTCHSIHHSGWSFPSSLNSYRRRS
ncbi:hypothetical protein STEG23_020278 [Scotinomys teguina]